MKTTITYEFTDRDIELLKQQLPEYPCDKCRMDEACCGCEASNNYNKIVKEYKDNDIYDFALDVKKYKDLCEQQIKLKIQADKIFNSFPIEIQNILNK